MKRRASDGRPNHANPGGGEAERLRRHNEEMKLALAEDLTLAEARSRLSMQRFREWEAQRAVRQRCGTADVAPQQSDVLQNDSPSAPERPQFWWDRI